jgi:hypothetical protein
LSSNTISTDNQGHPNNAQAKHTKANIRYDVSLYIYSFKAFFDYLLLIKKQILVKTLDLNLISLLHPSINIFPTTQLSKLGQTVRSV